MYLYLLNDVYIDKNGTIKNGIAFNDDAVNRFPVPCTCMMQITVNETDTRQIEPVPYPKLAPGKYISKETPWELEIALNWNIPIVIVNDINIKDPATETRCLVRRDPQEPFEDHTDRLFWTSMRDWHEIVNRQHPLDNGPKPPWKPVSEPPTRQQCDKNACQFIAWDGSHRYLTRYDQYDKIFRTMADIGGIPAMRPDEKITHWAPMPNGPF